MKYFLKILVLTGACLFTVGVYAKDTPGKIEAEIKDTMQKRFPKLEITSVTKTSYLGLYEVQIEGQLAYTDAKAKYLFQGNIFDVATLQNLTKEKAEKLSAIDFKSLPFDLAIKNVKGNGKRQVAVFSDPDCPYCKQLEKDLANVTDVTIYTFLYPLEGLHPDAPRKSKAIWCAADKVKAWDDAMLNDVIPPLTECETPLVTIGRFGRKHRINGTPTLVFPNGQTIPGLMPRADLEKALGDSGRAPAVTKEPAKESTQGAEKK